MIICVSIDVPLHGGHGVLFAIFICVLVLSTFWRQSKWMFYYSLNFFFPSSLYEMRFFVIQHAWKKA